MDSFAKTLIEIVLVFFTGWAASSYASTVIYRLPLKRRLFARDPYCDNCGGALSPRDLLPIISWMLTGGRCSHCGSGIPFVYFCIELLIPALFVLSYLEYGMGSRFFLMSLGGSVALILGAIYVLHRHISNSILLVLLFLGALHSVLEHGEIYPLVIGSAVTFFVGVALWQLAARVRGRDVLKNWDRNPATAPEWIRLAVVAVVWMW